MALTNKTDEAAHLDRATAGETKGGPRQHPDGEAISPQDPTSMPRADDHPGGIKDSEEFHDRPGGTNPAPKR